MLLAHFVAQLTSEQVKEHLVAAGTHTHKEVR
jgi:hypothetical protein